MRRAYFFLLSLGLSDGSSSLVENSEDELLIMEKSLLSLCPSDLFFSPLVQRRTALIV
ncbi:hypothetical protein KP509_35G033900 [Ceratopteris richardii]|uniref:Secreted protein n=1 Tax=Ceratopteris richardii TaxID=49495 RepID=A0A8T2QEE8_CERRI|nr:hypothetical protein KP509_35G033900 [Ceratopteris richardii]